MQVKTLSLAIITEGTALVFLNTNSFYGYIMFYATHTIASFLISVFLYPFLPQHFKTKKKHFVITTTLIISSTFIVGFIFSIIVYLWAMRRQKDHEITPIMQISHKDFYEFPAIKRSFGEGSATKLEGNKTYKIKLLTMISEFKTRETLSVVQKGISEEDDEVRLTSFSIVNKFTNKINEQIKSKLDEFEKSTDPKEKGEIAKELAKSYWDLIYFGLSDLELEKYILQMIERYTDTALELTQNDSEALFLKGRLFLYKKDLDNAEKYITNSIETGYDKEKAYPYLAEVYFYKREYKKTKELIDEIAILERLDPRLQTIMNMWKN